MDANEAERQRWNDEIWASVWPKRERLTNQVTPFLLEALELRRGERVLDIGCGGGNTSLAAAAAVGAQGAVVGADISKPILALAERRAEEAAAGNVTFVHCDVQVDRVGGGHFDVAMSQFGVMFFDEPVTAFANIRAHLRGGGRLGFACWQPLDRNSWFPGPVLAPFLPAPRPPAVGKSPTGPFTLGDPGLVIEILTAAGFLQISSTAKDMVIQVPRDAIVDDEQLTIMGVAATALGDARGAVRRHLSHFGESNGDYSLPLAFQVFTSRRD